MSRIIQFKRFGAAALANTIGANGEIIFDITNKALTVHDGVVAGGYPATSDTTARNLANAAFIRANSANVLAQASFNQANSSTALAESGTVIAIYANNASQAALTRAQAAFNQANTAAQTVPQNAQTTNYTLQLSDAGKHIYYTQSSNVILYVPTTSNVAFSNGTTIMIVSRTSSSANVTVSPNTGVSMFLAGNTTSASRNVTTHGVVTLINVAANTWFISGSGVV
jgi:hypothetical protein